MEIRFYLRIIQRGWWLILICAVVAVNFSLLYSYYIITPRYESVARFIVSPNIQNIDASSAGRDVVNSLEALDKRSIISTYAEVLDSIDIKNAAIELLHEKPENFSAYETSVTVLPDANILRFSVKGPNPEVAAILANSIGQHAIDFVRNVYVVYDLDFLDKAVASTAPFEPQPVQDASLALLVGIVIGVGLAIFRDQLSSTLDKLNQRKMIDYESLAYTRSYFERFARDEIAGKPESVVTLGFIYLNGLESYYDSLPQAYINQIMRKITDALKYQLRGNDVVGRWSPLYFAVLLPSTDGASAQRRMSSVREVLSNMPLLEAAGEAGIRLDPRIGLADRQGGESFHVLVSQVEQALEISMQSDEKIYLYKIRPFG